MSQTLEVKISPKVYVKYTSYLEYRSIFEIYIALFQQEKILIKVTQFMEKWPSG